MRTDLHGRNKIYSPVETITADNVIEVLNAVLPKHYENVRDEDYLYWYRRGIQPILQRTKQIREEILNKVVVNVASEIVAFKNGYFLTQPTFYVARKNKNSAINKLNDYLYTSGKNEADNVCVDWFHTVGLGVIYVESSKEEDTPVKCYGIDPRQAFVVYSRRPGNEPLFGVNIVIADNVMKFDVFTKTNVYRLEGTASVFNGDTDRYSPKGEAKRLVDVEYNALGEIPIVEYSYDRNRMSAFENVIPLMDALNNITSNRADGIEQFIQSLMVFYNCSLGNDEEGNPITPSYIRESGAIFLKSIGQDKADLKILNEQLNQSETQVLINDLMKQICDIAGVPFTSSMTSSSDNVGAVYLRSGWATSDTMARNTEDCYRESNRYFDKIFLKVLAQKDLTNVKLHEISVQFTRNEMDNLLVKTQGALNLKMLGLSPELVLAKSGVSNDPSGDVAKSQKYIDMAYEVVNETNEGTDTGNRADTSERVRRGDTFSEEGNNSSEREQETRV